MTNKTLPWPLIAVCNVPVQLHDFYLACNNDWNLTESNSIGIDTCEVILGLYFNLGVGSVNHIQSKWFKSTREGQIKYFSNHFLLSVLVFLCKKENSEISSSSCVFKMRHFRIRRHKTKLKSPETLLSQRAKELHTFSFLLPSLHRSRVILWRQKNILQLFVNYLFIWACFVHLRSSFWGIILIFHKQMPVNEWKSYDLDRLRLPAFLSNWFANCLCRCIEKTDPLFRVLALKVKAESCHKN